MYYVYILQSVKSGKLYIGSTSDVKKRIIKHNQSEVFSTKPYIPWILIYTEGYRLKSLALKREHNLKYQGRVLKLLLRRLGDSLS